MLTEVISLRPQLTADLKLQMLDSQIRNLELRH